LRSYFVRIEIEKMPVAEIVEQMLDALSMMPAAFQPEVDLEHRNVHGRIVVCFAFTVHAPTLSEAGTIAGSLFNQAAHEAGLDTGERVMELDEVTS
jgi:hypothetical protein